MYTFTGNSNHYALMDCPTCDSTQQKLIRVLFLWWFRSIASGT